LGYFIYIEKLLAGSATGRRKAGRIFLIAFLIEWLARIRHQLET